MKIDFKTLKMMELRSSPGEVLDRVAAATRRILEVGPAAAMNEFNRRDRNGPAEE